MAYILILGVFAFFAARLLGGRRAVTPRIAQERIVQEALSEPRVATAVRREPLAKVRPARGAKAATVPIMAETPAGAPGYILGGRRGGPLDTMAAVMDVMSGPGVCTPRNG